jgi:hypothetical protein
VNLMIESGVKSIDTFARTDLASEKGAPPPPPEPVSKKQDKSSKKKDKGDTKKKAAPTKEIAKVVERRTLTVTMKADQAALQNVMNKLASSSQMPYFTIVRMLRVDNEKLEGPLRASVTAPVSSPPIEEEPTDPNATPPPAEQPVAPAPAAGAPPGAPGTPPAPGAVPVPVRELIEPAKPAPPDAVYVFGDELLRVYMEIDLVRFLEPAAEAKAEEAAAK